MGLSRQLGDALAQQLRDHDQAVVGGARPLGWKVGAGAAEHLDGYVLGSLTTATLLAPGAAYRPEGGADLHADAEVVAVIGSEGTIAGYTCAVELCDLTDPGGPAAAVAANVFHRALCLAPGSVPGLDPRAAGRLVLDGDLVAEAVVPDDCDCRVACVEALLRAVGRSLLPHDVVLTGAVVQVPVRPGQRVRAEVEGLGSATVVVGASRS